MAATGKSKTCVWRWQERFMREGVDGLLRDKTRPPGIAPLDRKIVDTDCCSDARPPPHEATHWTVREEKQAHDGCSAHGLLRRSPLSSGFSGGEGGEAFRLQRRL